MHDWLGLLSFWPPMLARTTSYLSAEDEIEAVEVRPSLLISMTDLELLLTNPVCASLMDHALLPNEAAWFEPKLGQSHVPRAAWVITRSKAKEN